MKNLITSIERFKKVYQKQYIEPMQKSIPQLTFDQPIFEFKNQATQEEIALFEREINQNIPTELRAFYTQIGQLKDENEPENLTVSIPSLADLRSKKGDGTWTQTPSFGLIDMMKLHWGNDRRELNEGAYFSVEQIQQLNERYTCIGYWCTTVFYEEAYFIVFDRNHQFIAITYNQNKFGALQTQLLEWLKNDIPKQSLEELLIAVFQRLEKQTLAFAEDW